MSGITDPAEAYFKDGLWGWDGSVWRKLPLVFGCSSVLAFRSTDTISGAGGHIRSGSVSEGKIWVVTGIAAWDDTSAATRIRLFCRHDGANILFADETRAFAATDSLIWGGHLYLDHEDQIEALFEGGLADDVCFIDITGYKMLIAE